MLIPKHKATKLGIAPRGSYEPGIDIGGDLNVYGSTYLRSSVTPRILLPCHPLFVPSYYYASPLISFSPNDITWNDFLADTIYAFAYPVPRKIMVSKIAINIGGASGTAGSTLRMGLYDAEHPNILGMPYNLIRDFGEVATDSTGIKAIDFSDNKLTLPSDLYWLVLNNSHNLVDIIGGTATMGVQGYMDEPRNAAGFCSSYTYGAFPNIFPTPIDGGFSPHKIGLRFGFWVDSLLE